MVEFLQLLIASSLKPFRYFLKFIGKVYMSLQSSTKTVSITKQMGSVSYYTPAVGENYYCVVEALVVTPEQPNLHSHSENIVTYSSQQPDVPLLDPNTGVADPSGKVFTHTELDAILFSIYAKAAGIEPVVPQTTPPAGTPAIATTPA